MPNRGGRSHGQRPSSRIGRSHVELLEKFISEHTGAKGYGKRWVKDWLLCVDSTTLIPPEAPVTLIEGLRMLFEFPYGTLVYRLAITMKRKFDIVVAIGDKSDTKVLVIYEGHVLETFTHKAHKFRFVNRTELEKWMVERAATIRDAFRRYDK